MILQHFKKLLIVMITIVSACSSLKPTLVQEGDVYLFQGKEQIIVSFREEKIEQETLNDTAQIIALIQNQLPKELTQESVFIEGLTKNTFYNFHLIADTLFFSIPYYHNKTLIYGYIASLYEEYSLKNQKELFIPLEEFQNLIDTKTITKKENELLLNAAVEFAVNDLFFVSILELLERPQRYFFPQKTREELYKVLIYPETLGFWKYLQFRFGKQMVLSIAQQKYTPESWHVAFGEEVNKLEFAYIETIKNTKNKSNILSKEDFYTQFTNSLQLYMSGTKKSLMSE